MSDFLFDIDEYKEGERVYQVRLVKDGTSDLGEILATFVDMSTCSVMRQLQIDEGYQLIVTPFIKGEGVKDIIDIDRCGR